MKVTWRQLITEEMEVHGDCWDDVESVACAEGALDREFNCDYSITEVPAFRLWTPKRVYFSHEYDGADDVRSVSRHPDGDPAGHIG